MKISVLGPGRWGSFIAWYLHKNGNNVTLWGRQDSKHMESLLQTRSNEYVTLSNEINLTTNLGEAVSCSDYIIISISSQGLRGLMQQINQIQNFDSKKYGKEAIL